jgi:hypothetical protein
MTASPGIGWCCVLTDTYLSGDADASATFEMGFNAITDVRWINAGTTGKRGVGYDYDKSSNSAIWIRVDPSNYSNEGVGGGRPLVKRVDTWSPDWLDCIF